MTLCRVGPLSSGASPPYVPRYGDHLGYIAARARDIMRTRYRSTPAYQAVLAEEARQREAAEQAGEQAAIRRQQARTAKERAEEEAFYVDGGTAQEWAIEQEARMEAEAQAKKKRATACIRSKVRSTPHRATNQQKEPS